MSLIKAEINALREEMDAKLVILVRQEVRRELDRRGFGPEDLAAMKVAVNPEAKSTNAEDAKKGEPTKKAAAPAPKKAADKPADVDF